MIAQFETTLRDSLKLKKVMQKRGLRRARAKCPECTGMLWGQLEPSRRAPGGSAIRMWCDGPCKRQMME